MGILLSRIYDKPSTRDTLEKIEQEIQNIEERRWDKIKREQFIVQILSFLPITILIANLCLLIYPSDSTWRDKLLLSVPITILNLVLWVCKKIIQWYSKWSLMNEETRLRKLQKEKKRILEMVCETESYRVATELLEKYDPKQLRRRERNLDRPSSPMNTTLSKISASPVKSPQQQPQHQHVVQNPVLFHHNQSLNLQTQTQPLPVPISTPAPVPAPPPPTPITKQVSKAQLNTTSNNNLQNTSMTSIAASSVQGRPVRPILNKDRSLIERIVDFVVADGPDNRFALICRFCYGHNGMSLAEEYETINFRCCYCYNLNTTTNKRHQVHDQLQSEREKASQADKEEKTDEISDIKKNKKEDSNIDLKASRKLKEKLENNIKEKIIVNENQEKFSAVLEEETTDMMETTTNNNHEIEEPPLDLSAKEKEQVEKETST